MPALAHLGAFVGTSSVLNSAQKETPHPVGWRDSGKAPGDDLLSHGLSHTTIGAAAFHFRVRYGIGWFHSANFTRETAGASPVGLFDKREHKNVQAFAEEAPTALSLA